MNNKEIKLKYNIYFYLFITFCKLIFFTKIQIALKRMMGKIGGLFTDEDYFSLYKKTSFIYMILFKLEYNNFLNHIKRFVLVYLYCLMNNLRVLFHCIQKQNQ